MRQIDTPPGDSVPWLDSGRGPELITSSTAWPTPNLL